MVDVKVVESEPNEGAQEREEAQTGETAAPSAASVFDPDTATPEQWRAECARKDEELQGLQDKLLRLAADMENTRKRLERERREGISYANESLIRAFLPVLDNLERALAHGAEQGDARAVLDGVRMTAKSFVDVLERFGCKAFDAVGKPFDPNFHEAMIHQESDEQPDNTVLQEYQKGYLLHDRLLRPSMVIVAKAAKRPNPAEQDNMEI